MDNTKTTQHEVMQKTLPDIIDELHQEAADAKASAQEARLSAKDAETHAARAAEAAQKAAVATIAEVKAGMARELEEFRK